MALKRAYEEHEVGTGLRRIFTEARSYFDLPFVPTIIKVLAGHPEYLKRIWDDLAPVLTSREFHAASKALEEFVHSEVIGGGWRFEDQQRVLAAENFSRHDIAVLNDVVSTFSRAIPRLALFVRLLQHGYTQGQPGSITPAKSVGALSQLISVQVPNEKQASLRVWLIYADVKKTTGSSHVLGLLRVISPYPGYLASVWTEMKHIFQEPSFVRAAEEIGRRVSPLLVGLPVHDHRIGSKLKPEAWREIEQLIDGCARQLPQFALAAAVWNRAFPQYTKIAGAA